MWWDVLRFGLAATALTVFGAAPVVESPRTAKPGYWDVSLSAKGTGARRSCLADPMILAQWEHRRSSCTRVILTDQGGSATVHYSCAGGGFGQSVITLITPRSIKVNTQGISNGAPFAYVLYARRAGDCRAR